MAKNDVCSDGSNCSKCNSGMFGGFYGLAFVGVAIYYIAQADGFWIGVLGLLKAIVWPAFLMYKVFTMLGM